MTRTLKSIQILERVRDKGVDVLPLLLLKKCPKNTIFLLQTFCQETRYLKFAVEIFKKNVFYTFLIIKFRLPSKICP